MPCSPRRRIRLVTVACGLRLYETRLGSVGLRRLGTSNACRDHTVLPYAKTPFVLARPRDRSRVLPRALRPRWRASVLASTTSRPAFVTTRDPPLLPERDGIIKAVIWVESEPEYFYAGDWTTQISLKSLSNFR